MKRREFISSGCSVCLGVAGLAALLAGMQRNPYIPGKLNKYGLIIETDDFKIKQKGKTNYHSYSTDLLTAKNRRINFFPNG